jgi:hypothetical protein
VTFTGLILKIAASVGRFCLCRFLDGIVALEVQLGQSEAAKLTLDDTKTKFKAGFERLDL